MKKILLLNTFFLIVFGSLFGQSQLLFDENKLVRFVVRYGQGNDSVKNQIFAKIAEGNSKSVSNIRLNFSYNEHRQILKRGNRLELIVRIKDILVSGDNMYRAFEVGETLYPKKVSFTLQWLAANQVVNSYTFNDMNVGNGDSELVHLTVNDSLNSDNYKIRVVNSLFDYTAQNKSAFDAKVLMIDNYYAENAYARSRLRFINTLNADRNYLSHLENLNQLYEIRDTAQRAEAYVNSVKQSDFYRSLPLPTCDPSGLKAKLTQIHDKASLLQNVCNELIDNFDKIYYERGLEMLARHNPAQADYFFNKSLEINSGFAPSHFQLARLYYNSGYIDKAIDKIFQIRGMNPDTETKIQTVELAKGIYNDFLLNAAELNQSAKFDDALAVLSTAAKICRDFPEVLCRNAMDIEFANAINGKYHAILNMVDIQFRNENLNEAERIINDLIAFKAQNSDVVRDNNELNARILTLYQRYIEKGDRLNYNKNYMQAINAYDNAARVCNGYRQINCSEALSKGYKEAHSGMYNSYLRDADKSFRAGNNADAENYINRAIAYRKKYNVLQSNREDRLFLDIKQAIYNALVAAGKELAASKRHEDALAKFKKAVNISSNYAIRKNLELNSYINDSAEKLVLEIVENGKNKVQVNDLSEARKLYKRAKLISETYSVDVNPKVVSAKNELKQLIFERECINAQNAYDLRLKDALSLINAHKYKSADKKIDEALSIAKRYEKCELDIREAQSKKNAISPAVKYIADIEKVEEYLKRQNFKSAIENYMAAEQYYKVQKVKEFEISHTPLFDFIQQSYSDFIIYGVGFYTHNKEYDKALDLLRELSRRRAKARYTKDMQAALAGALAKRDHDIDRRGSYKNYIAKYTSGNRFFRYFKRAYKKQWKNLN